MHDTLLDDYSKILFEWESGSVITGAKAVKLLNGIYGTQGTWPHVWKGVCVSRHTPPEEIMTGVSTCMSDGDLRGIMPL